MRERPKKADDLLVLPPHDKPVYFIVEREELVGLVYMVHDAIRTRTG